MNFQLRKPHSRQIINERKKEKKFSTNAKYQSRLFAVIADLFQPIYSTIFYNGRNIKNGLRVNKKNM